ncbi:MAG: TrkA family potassium uptake protein [Gammaproteobacteria bacterium]
MYLIVIGAGDIGSSLVELALKAGHDVVVIEADKERAEHVAASLDALVLNAAIAEDGIMEEAGAERADAFIATTGDDSTNLMAMFLGQEYGIRRLTSIVNQAHHRRLFERLNVHVLVDPEVIVARHLLDMVMHPRVKDVAILGEREQLLEVTISESSALVGQRYVELSGLKTLPAETFIVCIERDKRVLQAAEDLRLQAGDVLILLARRPLSEAELEIFTGGA